LKFIFEKTLPGSAGGVLSDATLTSIKVALNSLSKSVLRGAFTLGDHLCNA
jgi:hypothetical protein